MGRRAKKPAFEEIKSELTIATALGLPNVMKPFFLYSYKRLETAV
jgi:hypothetical protein